MPTVIDEFVVELGLDPSKFSQQQRDALEKFKRTQEAARAGAKDLEESGSKVVDALGGIKTQALQMFAAVAGGKGIIDFSTSLTHADAAVGRLERNLGVSSRTITAWQGAARIFGGDAKTMAQSFTSISDAFAGWKIGLVSPLIADLRAISTAGGTIIDVNKGVEQSFLDLSANLKAIHDRDPAQAGVLGRKIGLDPALFDLLIRGPTGVKEVLDYVKKIGVATKEDTDAFGELEKRMGQMGAKAESLGRKILVGQDGKGGLGSVILEIADVLNMGPKEAWDYLSRTDRMKLRRGEGEEKNTPGQPMFSKPDAPARPSSEAAPGTPASPEPASGTPASPARSTTPAPTGAFTSQAEKETFIRTEAQAPGKRPINPDVAMAVAKSEGFYTFNSSVPGEKSYGAFQLNISRDPAKPSLGDRFKADTGLDPANPANEKRAIQYALDEVRRDGWRQWYGARNTGIPRWAGIGAEPGATTAASPQAPRAAESTRPAELPRAPVMPQWVLTPPDGGAAAVAAVRSSEPAAPRAGAASGGNTNTTSVEINGPINVTPPPNETDPSQFADRFVAAIRRQSFAAQANDGQN